MKNRVYIPILFIFIFLINFQVKAEDKIAFIDLVYLYNNSNIGKEMNKEMNSERNKINKEFNEFQKKLIMKKKLY